MGNEIELPQDTLERLNTASESIDELEKFVQKAKLAGHDTSSAEQMIRERRQQIRKHKEAFFPGR